MRVPFRIEGSKFPCFVYGSNAEVVVFAKETIEDTEGDGGAFVGAGGDVVAAHEPLGGVQIEDGVTYDAHARVPWASSREN
jgi:hypothetical protein